MQNNSHFTKNLLLVYPEIPDTYWSYRHAVRIAGKKAVIPPLGLLTVAAMVPDGYECRLVDMNVEELTDEDLAWADMTMISAMIVQKPSLEEVIRRSKGAGLPVVVGGPYATSCHDEIEGVDHFVLDEGELTIPAFFRDLAQGTPQQMYRADGRARMEETPVPRFELCDLSLYTTLPVQFSRGCPFDCEFCDIVSLFGHKPRTKPPAHILRELDYAYELGFRGAVFIVDDNFIGNKRCTLELLGELKQWQEAHGYPYRFSTEASIDLAAKDDLLNAMADVGFNMVFIGLETPDEGSLAATGKVQNLKGDVKEAVRKIQRLGIEVTAGFIIGFDTDPPDIFQRQVDFIQELAVPTAMVGLLMALPNTRLWNRLQAEGRLRGLSSGDNTHHTELNFVTMLSESLLEEGYRYVLSRVYDPRRYFDRAFRFLKMHPRTAVDHETRAKEPIKWEQVMALVRSLLFQTFSRYGMRYLWYLIRAVFVRPKRIVRAVTLAVQGHHYFVITRRTLAMAGIRRPRKLTDPSAALTAADAASGAASGAADRAAAYGKTRDKTRRTAQGEVAIDGVRGTLRTAETSAID